MTGLEPLVVGYLAAWVARRARRLGDRVDGKVDQVLDASVDRLADLVLTKLGAEPAIAQMREEAAQGVDNERTKRRVQLAVEDAVERDERFAEELRALVEQIRSRSDVPPATTHVEITANATGNAWMPVVGSGTMINNPGESGGRQ